MHPTKNSGYVTNMLQLDYKNKEMLLHFVLATKMSLQCVASLKWQGLLRAWSFGILNRDALLSECTYPIVIFLAVLWGRTCIFS